MPTSCTAHSPTHMTSGARIVAECALPSSAPSMNAWIVNGVARSKTSTKIHSDVRFVGGEGAGGSFGFARGVFTGGQLVG